MIPNFRVISIGLPKLTEDVDKGFKICIFYSLFNRHMGH